MKVLSLFDGMSCGMLAMLSAGVEVEKYVAYEIDKYAVTTSLHNFPQIEQKGDVFTADFTQYQGFDFLVGGSPCTYWSIAQKNNRETTASGLGWELFSQYVRALRESKPRYFIYENNKSMSKAIRDSIRETFGFEEICINSALVSAQNRQRFYWVGKYNPYTDWYDKVDIQQPEDRGILLKDVLDGAEVYRSATEGKGFCLDASYWKTPGSPETFLEGGHARANRNMVAEPVPFNPALNGKSHTLTSSYYKASDTPVSEFGEEKSRPRVAEPVRVGCMPSPDGTVKGSQANRVYSVDGKTVNQVANGGGAGAGAKTGLYAVPVNTTAEGKAGALRATCYKDGIRNMVANTIDRKTAVAEPCDTDFPPYVEKKMAEAVDKFGYLPDMWNPYNNSDLTGKKGKTLTTCCGSWTASSSAVVIQYATPCEWDEDGAPLKAVSGADGKTYTVYRVQDGQIAIKGKSYPIKLADGYYIIRKLTVSECKRLQTVPEWYDFSCVSPTQAYKMLGNGWTVEVIAHLIRACLGFESLEGLEDWLL